MIIETWERICDTVESIIKDGQEACKRMCSTLELLLEYMDLPALDPIDEATRPKLKLEQIRSDSVKVKEHIFVMNQFSMEEIKN